MFAQTRLTLLMNDVNHVYTGMSIVLEYVKQVCANVNYICLNSFITWKIFS